MLKNLASSHVRKSFFFIAEWGVKFFIVNMANSTTTWSQFSYTYEGQRTIKDVH